MFGFIECVKKAQEIYHRDMTKEQMEESQTFDFDSLMKLGLDIDVDFIK